MIRNAKKEIDLAALQHNFDLIKQQAPNSKILAMIKANAYGHDALRIASNLRQADAFGVASLGEALTLRRAGAVQRIVLMSSFLGSEELIELARYDLEWVIHSPWQLDLLEKTELKSPIFIWFKIDTGMHRLGFLPDEVSKAYARIKKISSKLKGCNLLSHFACADEKENPMTSHQIELFNQLTKSFPGERSLANSAAIFAWPESHADWNRPGLALYGISPFPKQTGSELGLHPVMRLSAPLIAIHDIPKGDRIGYGSTYTCEKDTRVGIIGAGYADGYPRQAPSGTPVYLNKQTVPLIGRVSMDIITVDLTTSPESKVGDMAVLWGPELPIEILSKHSGVLTYQLLCNS